MRLASNYAEIVAGGVATLRAVSANVRAAAIRESDAPELWLVVRDHEVLADRLADLDERGWLDGFGAMSVTGQDLGVLDELLEKGVPLQGGERRLPDLSAGHESYPAPRVSTAVRWPQLQL